MAASAGEFDLGGSWPVEAGVCEQPSMLLLLVREHRFGTVVLLVLPPPGRRVTRYPVTLPDTMFPQPPAAHMGAHLLTEDRVFTFLPDSGSIELEAFGERVTGRIRVMLRENSFGAPVGYAAVFEAAPVAQLSAEQCRLLPMRVMEPDSGT